MGFQDIKTTATLTAKLTPLGRKLYVTNANNLITKFAIGDSDAFYTADNALNSGQVPDMGGTLGPNASTSNSTGSDTAIRYPIYYDSLGKQTKPVDSNSINITTTLVKNNVSSITVSGTDVTQTLIDYTDTTDPYINLFSSFGLPLNQKQKDAYSLKTFAQAGWSDTALSGISADTILVLGVDNSTYGENLDGREINITLTTSASSYSLYSTFQNTGQSTKKEDVNYKDSSNLTRPLGLSLGFLMSDDVLTPNGGSDATLSWATGFGALKPFSIGQKQLYNLQTNSNLAQSADSVTGIAYLDKGMLVITESTIVDSYNTAFSGNSATTVTFNSLSTDVLQNVTCVVGRGEFKTSINPSWNSGDSVRISELGLYDDRNRLIAYGKFDRHVVKTSNDFLAFGVKITM